MDSSRIRSSSIWKICFCAISPSPEGEASLILKMYKNGFTAEQIAAATDKEVEEVKAILASEKLCKKSEKIMEKVFLFGCNNIRKAGFFFRMKDSRSRGSTVFLWTSIVFLWKYSSCCQNRNGT